MTRGCVDDAVERVTPIVRHVDDPRAVGGDIVGQSDAGHVDEVDQLRDFQAEDGNAGIGRVPGRGQEQGSIDVEPRDSVLTHQVGVEVALLAARIEADDRPLDPGAIVFPVRDQVIPPGGIVDDTLGVAEQVLGEPGSRQYQEGQHQSDCRECG